MRGGALRYLHTQLVPRNFLFRYVYHHLLVPEWTEVLGNDFGLSSFVFHFVAPNAQRYIWITEYETSFVNFPHIKYHDIQRAQANNDNPSLIPSSSTIHCLEISAIEHLYHKSPVAPVR